MASVRRSVTQDRLRTAERMLLQRRNPSEVAAALTESEGISRRQARRYVVEALERIREDLDCINRTEMLALLVDSLNRTIAIGLERQQGAVVIGAVRTLNELLALGADHHQRLPHGGAYGRSKWQ